MSFYRSQYILDYFKNRGWLLTRQGNTFYYLKPKKPQKFPPNFQLEIPIADNSAAFNNYMNRILQEFPALVSYENSVEDFKVIFSKGSSIFKCRINDQDTTDGTLSFLKHYESVETIKNVISQAVTFVSTDKLIYGNAKEEVDLYLAQCRALQTEKGSWISNFELPSEDIKTLATVVKTEEVSNKLFDVIEFVDDQIIKPAKAHNVSVEYLADNKKYLNFELLQSIRDVYKKAHINNLEYSLSSTNNTRKVVTEKVQTRLGYFNQYLRDVKSILLNTISVEVQGLVTRLTSDSPKTAANSYIMLNTVIGGKKKAINIKVTKDQYLEALEAHKNERYIKVKGKAKENNKNIVISSTDHFEVI